MKIYVRKLIAEVFPQIGELVVLETLTTDVKENFEVSKVAGSRASPYSRSRPTTIPVLVDFYVPSLKLG